MYGPRFPVLELFDMCQPDRGKDAATILLEGDASPIAGFFESDNRLIRSAYNVPLKHGIPIQYDAQRQRDGHKKCFTLCEREWSA